MNKLVTREFALKMVIATVVAAFSSFASTNAAFGQNSTRSDASERTKVEGPKSQPKALAAGQTLERELHSGETHDYLIPLKAGEYAHVSIGQLNIDVSYTIYDPHGKTIATINWEDQGAPESLWLAADESGDYRLAITGVTVRGPNAHYITTLEKAGELETAPSADQTYVRAYRLFFRAGELSDQRNKESNRKAVEAYEQTLPLWRSVNDRIGEAFTLDGLGSVLGDLGELNKAIEAYKQAIEIWRSSKNHQREEAGSLHDLAMTGVSFSETLEILKKEQELRRLLNDSKGQALVLSNMGAAYLQQADFEATLACFQEALTLGRESGDRATEARILSNIGAVYFSLGEFQRAFDYSKQVLPLRRAAGDRRGESITLTNLGSIYRELGEPERSLEYYRQALPLIRQVGDPSTEAAVLDALGLSYYALRDYPKALDCHQQSLSIRRELKDKIGEGSALNNIANAYARIGESTKALDYFEQSLQLRRATGDRRGQTLTLQNAGELYWESGEIAKARTYFEQGLDLSRSIKNRFFEAQLLYDLARIEQNAGYPGIARTQVESAIDIIESTSARVTSTDLRASFLASKQDFYELDIDLLMQSYLRDRTQESLIKAFSVSERERARSLLDNLKESGTQVRAGILPELLQRERALRAKLNQAAESQVRLLGGQHTQEQVTDLARKVEADASEYEQLLAEIRRSSPHYAALTQPMTISLDEVQRKVLDPDTLLLEYALGSKRSYLWVVSKDSISGFELPPRAEIESRARSTYDLMTARNHYERFEKPSERQARIAKADEQFEPEAAALSRLLLPSAVRQSNKHRLLIVSDGALQYLPFAALPVPEVTQRKQRSGTYEPLISKFEIITLPSASTLAVLRNELAGRMPAPRTIAVLADPVFDKNDERVKRPNNAADQSNTENSELHYQLTRSMTDLAATDEGALLPLRRLPFTRLEADAIAELTSPDDRKDAIGFAANRDAALDPQLAQYRYIHFATHGLLNTQHPELSGIVLSLVDQNGKEQDGFLLANEIYNLNLSAELVVLSGCKTGLGKEIKGEGILSLTRSFMYAGAARVMVSLWDVNDKSTAQLMTQFYRAALGKDRLSPAAALRNAQIAMWKSGQWHAPYYWAAFVLQGEYP
jgi:CHAT domain-containing protein/tetratricopeptide (TPR) repeat protein